MLGYFEIFSKIMEYIKEGGHGGLISYMIYQK